MTKYMFMVKTIASEKMKAGMANMPLKSANHQYSESRARPLNTKYFL
jgi:hypothetical protein